MTERIQELAGEWHERFSAVMEAMADFRPVMEAGGELRPAAGPVLWWKQYLDVSPGAAVWIGATRPAWSALGQKILAAAGIDSADEEECKGTYLEVIRQSISALATAVGAHVGREVLAKEGAEEEPGAGGRCRIAISAGDQALPDLVFAANRELVDALPGSAPAQQTVEDSEPLTLSPRACDTLNLLMDVEMPVSVSFGRTQIRIQEVLKLITGSIIELDRSISEPVEVIVNNCVVARGEVVVVDGNYGVRIHEVMSRRERLQESRKYLLPLSRAS